MLQLVAVCALCLVTATQGYSVGAPCQAADHMTPNPTYHGKPQDPVKNPPKFNFHVINPEGYVAKTYQPDQSYTIRISGSTYFRGFLVQARKIVDGRITATRVGTFEKEDSNWDRIGLQYQNCSGIQRDSVTHKDARRKYYLNLKWRTTKLDGPIQFAITIVQNQTYFWANWLPAKGLLQEAPKGGGAPPLPTGTSNRVQTTKDTPTTRNQPKTNPKPNTTPRRISPPASEAPPATERATSAPAPRVVNTPPPPVPPRPNPNPRPQPPPEQIPLAPAPRVRPQGNPYPLGKNGPRVHPPPTKQEVVAVAPFAYVEVIPTSVLVQQAAERSDESGEQQIDPSEYGKDFCESNPCQNGASCENEPTGFYCVCPSGYTGNTCNTYDYCAKSPCTQNGVCQLNEFGYECVCDRGFSGRKCELRCPEYVCKNEGTCFVDNTNSYACKCPPGWTGKSCEKNINECESSPCRNGATCEDLQNNYRCNCLQGFHGKNCQRLCVDVYKSCGNQWKDEDRCETMRYLTRFFEVNCPVACGGCVGLDTSLLQNAPIPPKLEPFSFLLGKWIAKVGQKDNFPINMQEPFESEMEFKVTDVPMFGSPVLNYSIVSTDQYNRSVHIVNGFFMLARTRPITVSVSSTGNSGFTLIEEGQLNTTTNRLDLVSVFNSTIPRVTPLFPKLIRRSIYPSGNYLSVQMTVLDGGLNEASFQHYYTRSENYQPLKAGPILLQENR